MAASCYSKFARSFGRSTLHSTLLLIVLGALLRDEKRGRGGNGSSVGHGDRCYIFPRPCLRGSDYPSFASSRY